MVCPDYDQIELFLTGDLDHDGSQAIRAHLAACPHCDRRVKDVSSNIEVLPAIRGLIGVPASSSSSGTGTSAGRRIGAYEIKGELGRGGMGVVYEAVQHNPRRTVALKVLDLKRSSPETLRRFEYESQILGQLRHPGIAQVYEAGTDDDNGEQQPFFAMELVQGRSLRDHARNLPSRALLELLARICDAVHHAHQKGVVHRDLKPSNILVDVAGSPKILDFGVARITHADLESATLHTESAQLLGTLPYMSPEQAAGDSREVDIRTDVYALGIVAYELLAGRPPFELEGKSIPAALRVIQQDDPPRLGAVKPALRGDVEAIVARAMAKDKRMRYQSAAQLGEDIRRFLRHEPIRAARPGAWYVAGKFARRHRGFVGAILIIFAILIAATVVSASQANRARAEAAKLKAVIEFIEDMLSSADPTSADGDRDVTVRHVLAEAAKKLDGGSLADDPEIEIPVRATIGNTYRALGDNPAAEPHLRRAVELGRETYPNGHEDLAYAMHKLARLTEGTGRLEEAESLSRESLAMRRGLLGPDHDDIATSLNNLGWLLHLRGKHEERDARYEESIAMRRRLHGDVDTGIATTLNNMAIARYSAGDYAEAERLYRESLEMDKALRGELHINVVYTSMNLAVLLQAQGRAEEAEPLLREAVDLQIKLLGPDHPDIAKGWNNLAKTLEKLGQFEEAEELFRESIELDRRVRGEAHPNLWTTRSNLAILLADQGRYDEAEAIQRDVLDAHNRILGESHPSTIATEYHLAKLTLLRDGPAAAEPALAEVVARARRDLPEGHWSLGTFLLRHGECLGELDRLDEALPAIEEAVAIFEAKFGPDHARTREAKDTLADLRPNDAESDPH